MKESDRWFLLFLGWCAVFIGLLFGWIGWESEPAAWLALGWVVWGIWQTWNSTSEAEVRRTQEFRRQFLPGSATEWQRQRIKNLCDDLGRDLPPDLENMSEADAKGVISGLTGKVVEL